MKRTSTDNSLKAELAMHGFVFLPEHRANSSGRQVAESLGELLRLGHGPPVHQLLVKQRVDAPPNTYSGIYGSCEFPFHTDLAHWVCPPRYLLLRCIQGFREVPTMLIDTFHLVDQIGKEVLGRALVRPRRPINLRLPLPRILRSVGDDDALFRWDEKFLQPSGRVGRESIQVVKEQIAEMAFISVELAKPGDTLVVDNWRMLHARSRVPQGCEARCIERAYLGEIY